ncbi:N-acetylglucosamine kinase [Specibacter sp. NPDC057265]|uniref:N-acetylglucosamine kinase n=1 Tax=Specibacter sp. NPDC057265 TaxID=3346075 RepID=UPI00363ED9F7
MPNLLALDAGGTSTRAVLLTPSGQCLGYGTAGGGNPVSRGLSPALQALSAASRQALGGRVEPLGQVLVAMAGASVEMPLELLHDSFAAFGLSGKVLIESDLLATFYSGTFHDSGHALIAGTGAVGARVAQGRLFSVADGMGWLLGDAGSGFWLGREVAQAVGAALDGRGPATALTAPLLAELGIAAEGQADHIQGRLRAQQQLITKVYERSAIELSRFAPLVFAASGDRVAQGIIDRAGAALAQTLLATAASSPKGDMDAVTAIMSGPLIFGGSVLTKGVSVAAAVTGRLRARDGTVARPVLVADGAVGAAVMALKRSGIDVDAKVFARIQHSLALLR